MELSLRQVAKRLMGVAPDKPRSSYCAERLGLIPLDPPQATDPPPPESGREPLPSLLLPPTGWPDGPAKPRQSAPVEPAAAKPAPVQAKPKRKRSAVRHRLNRPKWEGPFSRRSFKLPKYLAMRLRIESHRQDRYLWDLVAEAIDAYIKDKQE